MKKDLISVVVPIYNVEKYINKCLDSIIKQTYDNLEIILVDDGSKDKCPKICDEYAKKDKRIKVIHKKNGGLSDARNEGIKNSSGKYITFIDSDDYIADEHIQILYDNLVKYNVDISISSQKVVYSSGSIIDRAKKDTKLFSTEEALKSILYDDGVDLTTNGKLYLKSLFDDILFPKGRLFEDAATTYKLIDKCDKIVLTSYSTYYYYIRNDSITTCSFSPKKMDLITSTKEMTDYISSKYSNLKDACDRRLMYAYLSTLSQLANSKEKYPKEQKILCDYIKKNGKKILKDKKAPKRDKIAIISLKLGFNFYKFSWKIYKKITGRKNK